jgi:hypothetical protein
MPAVKIIKWKDENSSEKFGVLLTSWGATAMVTQIPSPINEPLYCSFEVERVSGNAIFFSGSSNKLSAHLALALPVEVEEVRMANMSVPAVSKIVRCAGELCYRSSPELDELNDAFRPPEAEDTQEVLAFEQKGS